MVKRFNKKLAIGSAELELWAKLDDYELVTIITKEESGPGANLAPYTSYVRICSSPYLWILEELDDHILNDDEHRAQLINELRITK